MDHVQRTHAYLRMLDELVVTQPSTPRDVDVSHFVDWYPRVADTPGSAAVLAQAVAESEALDARCVHVSATAADGTAVARVLVEDGPLVRELDARLPAAWAQDLRDAFVCVVLARSATHEPLQLPDGTTTVVLGTAGRDALRSARKVRRFPTPTVLSGIAAALVIVAIILSVVYR